MEEARDMARRRWSGVPVLEYVDDGVSGAVDPAKRDGFRSLMRDWIPGDALVFWRLDRLARSLLGFADTMRAAQDAGVMLVSVHDSFDLTTPDGRMQANIVATFAEWERELIRSRVAATRRTLHKAGRWPGGRAPYGLMPVPHPSGEGKALARDPEAASVIREIVKRVTDGEGITPIARDLTERGIPSPRVHTSVKANPKPSAWSSASVRDVLGHPNIVGHSIDPVTGRLVRENGLPVEVHPPVVSVHERDLAVAALPAVTGRAATKDRHWLYGVVKCGQCEANMHFNSSAGTKSPDVAVFKCYGTNRDSHGAVTARVTDVEAHLEASVLDSLGGAFRAERKWVGGSDSTADLERLRAYLEEMEEDRRAGMYATKEALARFRSSYADTARQIEELEARPVISSGWQVVPTDEYLADAWARWTPEERGAWLREWNVFLSIFRPAIKRARVPLSDRSEMDWGGLLDLAVEMDAVRADAD